MQFKAYSKFLLSNSQTLKEILTARLEDNPENFSECFFDYCEFVSEVDLKNEGYKLHQVYKWLLLFWHAYKANKKS